MNWKYVVISLLGGLMLFHITAIIYISGQNYEVTSKDYYEREIQYQDHMDKLSAGKAFVWDCDLSTGRQWLHVTIEDTAGNPVELQNATIFLYRPNDSSQDRDLPLESHENLYRVPAQGLIAGAWRVTINAEHDGTPVAWEGFLSL